MTQNLKLTTARWKRSHLRGLRYKRTMPSPEVSQMHVEGRLLVLCARTTFSEFVRVEVEDLVVQSIDWESVWRLSRIHGVAPLVYRTLSSICPASVPPAIHDSFHRHIQANALLNSLLAKELAILLEALAAKGVHAIPFKGVTLAQSAYGDLSLRECAELELIVEQASIPQASQAL